MHRYTVGTRVKVDGGYTNNEMVGVVVMDLGGRAAICVLSEDDGKEYAVDREKVRPLV